MSKHFAFFMLFSLSLVACSSPGLGSDADQSAEGTILGIYSETHTNNMPVIGKDADIMIYDGTFIRSTKTDNPPEGSQYLHLSAVSGKYYFRMNFMFRQGRDLSYYANGYLKLLMRGYKYNFEIGIEDNNMTDLKPYGFTNDGQWHRIIIPINKLNYYGKPLNMGAVTNYFNIVNLGQGFVTGDTYDFDDIYITSK